MTSSTVPAKAPSTEVAKVQTGKYEKLVQKAREIIETARLEVLSTYWNIGDLAISSEKPEYGSHNIEKFAEDIGLDKATVYATVQFVRAYPEKSHLERAVERGLSWSHIRALLSGKIDDATRDKLEQKVEKENLSVKEFQDEVKKVIGRTNQPSVKIPDSPSGTFFKAAKLADKLTELLGAFPVALADVKTLEGEGKADALTAYGEVKESLKVLRDTIISLGLK